MKRLFLAALLACTPALANDRAKMEAQLDGLSTAVWAEMVRTLVLPQGLSCDPPQQDASPANRRIAPNWKTSCQWDGGSAQLIVVLSPDLAHMFSPGTNPGSDYATDIPGVIRFYGTPVPYGFRRPGKLIVSVSAHVAAQADFPAGPVPEAADPVDALALALHQMAEAGIEDLPELEMHQQALAEFRTLLEADEADLADLLAALPGDPPQTSEASLPDLVFFGRAPFVQGETVEQGVTMTVTLTTSTFALEAAAEEGRFGPDARNGDFSRSGVFHDRGRVKVYLGENGLTALLDGRGMLMLDVKEAAKGADPVAAMEAVLARIAAHDFTDY